MTKEEIFRKTIEKAVKNGWKKDLFRSVDIDIQIPADFENLIIGEKGQYRFGSVIELIFNHDFAKALWGFDNKVCPVLKDGERMDNKEKIIPAWQYHLHQMVLKEDPILYLKDFINK